MSRRGRCSEKNWWILKSLELTVGCGLMELRWVDECAEEDEELGDGETVLFLVDSGAGSCGAASGALPTFCCVFAAAGESFGVLSERSDLLFAATTGVLGGFDELKKRPPPKDEYRRCDAGRR